MLATTAMAKDFKITMTTSVKVSLVRSASQEQSPTCPSIVVSPN